MEDYQQRVINEKRELDKKIVGLTAFLFSDASSVVEAKEKQRMLQQMYAMIDYSRTLNERIINF